MTTRRTFLATLTAAIAAFFAPTVVPARTLPRIIPRPDPDVLHHLGLTFVHDRKGERIIISGPVRSIFAPTKDEDGPVALTNSGLIVRLDDIRGIGAPWHGSVALYHNDVYASNFNAERPLFEERFRGDTKTFNWLAKRAAEANGEQYVPIREDWVQYTQGRRLHRGFYDDDSPVWDTLAPPDGSNNG